MADPPRGFIESLSWWEFQSVPRGLVAHHRQFRSIGRPVRPLNSLHEFTRGPAVERRLRQRSDSDICSRGTWMQGEGQFARGGDRQDLHTRKSKGARLRALRASDEDFRGRAFPGRGVNDGFAVLGESRGKERASTKGKLVVGGVGKRPAPGEKEAKSDAGRKAEQHGGSREGQPLPGGRGSRGFRSGRGLAGWGVRAG